MKSCDVTIQMKPLQRHFQLLLFASKHFTPPKNWKFGLILSMATSRIEQVSCVSHAWAYHASATQH